MTENRNEDLIAGERARTLALDLDIISNLQLREPLSRASAEAVLTMGFSAAGHREMRELLEKNNAGTLTEREWDKLDSYRRVGCLINLMQAQAKLRLDADT